VVDQPLQGAVRGGLIAVLPTDEKEDVVALGFVGDGHQREIVSILRLSQGFDGDEGVVCDPTQIGLQIRVGVRDRVADERLILLEFLPERDGVGHGDVDLCMGEMLPALPVVAEVGIAAGVVRVLRVAGVVHRPAVGVGAGGEGQVEGDLSALATPDAEVGPVSGVGAHPDLIPVLGDAGHLSQAGVFEIGVEFDHCRSLSMLNGEWFSPVVSINSARP
jgi:hypothetical protein